MGESPSSALPQLDGLTIEAVEWLPSGADSGLVRVRGRWSSADRVRASLPSLVLMARGGREHRFESLPDARFARDPASWRGSYLVPAALVAGGFEWLVVEWAPGVRAGLPPLAPGLAAAQVEAAAASAPGEPARPEPGGQVIDRAVLAERRARRAEAAEQAQARVAAEALRAVEALELQSAELERRLEEAIAERDAAPPSPPAAVAASARFAAPPAGVEPGPDPRIGPPAGVEPRPDPGVAELERLAARRQAALAGALGSLARLRAESREWRLRLRTSEIEHAGDAVRLAVISSERATGGAATRAALHAARREGEQQTAALAAAAAEAAGLRAELASLREGSAADVASARADAEQAREDLAVARADAAASLEAALAQAAGEYERLERRVAGERAVHAEVGDALRARVTGMGEQIAALEAARDELTAARSSAEARATELGARVEQLEAALETTETQLQAAEATAANSAARLRVESVARAALEDELDRERAARAALSAELDAEREDLEGRTALAAARDAFAADLAAGTAERDSLLADRDALAADLEAEREQALFAAAELLTERQRLEDERNARAAVEAELGALHEARAAVEAQLAAEREARAAAEAKAAGSLREEGALQQRIAELDRRAAGLADEVRLEQAAREQAEAAAAAARRPQGRMLADLDAAAAALRQAAPPPQPEPPAAAPPEPEPEPLAAAPEPEPEPLAATPTPTPEPPAPAPPARPRPTIVSAEAPPPRAEVVGRSARQYPPLRGAIVKLAHDDPQAAARLLAALLPAQAAAIATPLDYDLTIRELGTFSVTVTGGTAPARVQPLDHPRPRAETDFHLSADALTLAELLAGVDRRVGRLFGPARYTGSRRRLGLLRSVRATRLSLRDAARAGAELDPGLVYRALAYAVHPSWTRGERFTVAQEIAGEDPQTFHLTARDGAGLALSVHAEEADATVTMTRETFGLMLRGEPVPSGSRPAIRGDRDAVARLKAWMDRAQGLAEPA
ncbi:MAG: hypothetical protein QOE28_1611 [Solirubrobacteraceae bacterium]|nr:hypothetical protein [Solirubrobacteraceae bacterium]